MPRAAAPSHELLTQAFDHESVALVYQERLEQALREVGELAGAVGLKVGFEFTPSRQRIETASGFQVVERPIPPEIAEETYAKIDRILGAVRDRDFRGDARLFLLSLIDSEPVGRAWWRGFAALARKELSRPIAEDATTLRTITKDLADAFTNSLQVEPDREAWLVKTASFVDEPNLEGIKALFMYQYPEYAVRLTDDALAIALKAWAHRGGPRPDKSIPEKWVAAANVINGIGLGPIEPDSLEQQWQRRPFKPGRANG